MTQPSQYIIDLAIKAAAESPCAKSRRGAVVFTSILRSLNSRDVPQAAGCNAPPPGFACQNPCGPNACRELCVHAEQGAILTALAERGRPVPHLLTGMDLLHVKIDERGKLVAGGGPSCPQCSKLVVQTCLAGVWLYETVLDSVGYAAGTVWRYYAAAEFHRATLRNRGLMRKCGKYLGDNDGTSPQLTCVRDAGHKGDCDNVRGDG